MPAKPTIEQLREIAHMYGMHMSDADLESFRGLMSTTFESYRRLDQLTEPALPVRYARTGAIVLRQKTIRSTPGIRSVQSKGQRVVPWPGNVLRSRITSVSRGCR